MPMECPTPTHRYKTLKVLGMMVAGFLAPALLPAQLSFSNLDALLSYADANGATAQSNAAQQSLADLQLLAAKANVINLRGNASFTTTNNFAQPVSFIPAEIFGGPAGSFRQVTFGQQYVNVASVTPQLDLINPSALARLKSARLSEALTSSSNLLNQRAQHEAIAANYFGYRSTEAQLLVARKNLANSDSITAIALRRHESGATRKSDYNNAAATRLNLADFVMQLETKRTQYMLALRSLIGIGPEDSFVIEEEAETIGKGAEAPNSALQSRTAALQAALQRSELLAQRLNFLPTVSLTAGFNWQQNSNTKQFDNTEWIDSRFIGLKIVVPLPTETKLWSQSEEMRINLALKSINEKQVSLQESNQNAQLQLDLERATQSKSTAEAVLDLRAENHKSYTASYQEGLVGADVLLLSFTDYLNAQLNFEAAKWNLLFQYARLEINQKMQ